MCGKLCRFNRDYIGANLLRYLVCNIKYTLSLEDKVFRSVLPEELRICYNFSRLRWKSTSPAKTYLHVSYRDAQTEQRKFYSPFKNYLPWATEQGDICEIVLQ